jgi:hypothetical protein
MALTGRNHLRSDEKCGDVVAPYFVNSHNVVTAGEFVPIDLVPKASGIHIRWIRGCGLSFEEPFFLQTEAKLVSQALRGSVVETRLDELDRTIAYAVVRPKGFIYHTSRCGSTLLANLLRAIPGSLVLSEPSPLLAFLDGLHNSKTPGQDPAAMLPPLLSAIALGSSGARDPLFVKWFSRNVHQVFLYRDPLEVLVANLESPNQDSIWREAYTGLPLRLAVERSVAELIARGIGQDLRAMITHLTPQVLLVNYSEIGPGIASRLLELLEIPATPTLLDAMARKLAVNAKEPSQSTPFQPDRNRKRSLSTPFLRDMIDRFALEPYLALESLRNSRTYQHCTTGSRIEVEEHANG